MMMIMMMMMSGFVGFGYFGDSCSETVITVTGEWRDLQPRGSEEINEGARLPYPQRL
jgi:hypothetical protein